MRRWAILGFLAFGLAACSQEGATTRSGTIVDSVPSINELAGTPTVSISPSPTLDPEVVVQGAAIYAANCAECHGASLEGEANWQQPNPDGSFRAPPHDANGHTWHHSDGQLMEAIRLGGSRLPAEIGGTSAMPAFAEALDESEIAAVLAYIKSAWPEDIRQAQWQVTSQNQIP
jgi:mono/diheme cytochrome c family protein